jgi:hypothetical protein
MGAAPKVVLLRFVVNHVQHRFNLLLIAALTSQYHDERCLGALLAMNGICRDQPVEFSGSVANALNTFW